MSDVDSRFVSLDGETEEVVSFDRNYAEIEVVSDGTAAVLVKVDSEQAIDPDAPNGSYILPAVPCARRIKSRSQANTIVRLHTLGGLAASSVAVIPVDN